MVLVDLIIEETDVFFYCFKQKKIFSVILNLSNNTKYHRTGFFIFMSHLFYIALLDVLQAFLRKKRLDKNLPSLELFLRGDVLPSQGETPNYYRR